MRGMMGVVLAMALALGIGWKLGQAASDSGEGKVYELRKYVAHPGKLPALHARFRDHTCQLFRKHGMELIGFWTPTDGPAKDDTLIYLLAFPSRELAKASWKDFASDPDWKKAYADSHKDGPLVAKVESTYLKPTDYSSLK